MIDMRVRKLWFDSPKVRRAVDDATRRAMARIGAFVRTTAKRLIRPARRMSEAEMEMTMSPETRARWHRRRAAALRRGRVLKRPYRPSEPGQPPRSRTGLLKKFIFFSYDPSTRSVVIGPAKLVGGSHAPEILEYGGTERGSRGGRVKVEARPYTHPALKANLHLIPEQWRDSAR